MDIFRTPDEKLKCLIECTNIMSEILTITSVADNYLGAD